MSIRVWYTHKVEPGMMVAHTNASVWMVPVDNTDVQTGKYSLLDSLVRVVRRYLL